MTNRYELALVLLSAVSFGCSEGPPPVADVEPTRHTSNTLECIPTTIQRETVDVMRALAPHCAGCHSAGTLGEPYFESAAAFQALMVQNPRLVAPGAPDASELVLLLEGRGTGSSTQMPLGAFTYEDLVDAGAAEMPMSQIRAWVSQLEVRPKDTSPDADAPRFRRMSARQIRDTLYQQLGLSEGDFFREAQDYDIDTYEPLQHKHYPMAAPEDLPASRKRGPKELYFSLGGGSAIEQASESRSITQTGMLVLTPLSQAWCRVALQKEGNTALFGDTMSAPTDDQGVKKLLSRWGMLFWAERLEQDAIDMLFDSIYTPIATAEDQTAGLTGVCSFFIRHPKWLEY